MFTWFSLSSYAPRVIFFDAGLLVSLATGCFGFATALVAGFGFAGSLATLFVFSVRAFVVVEVVGLDFAAVRVVTEEEEGIAGLVERGRGLVVLEVIVLVPRGVLEGPLADLVEVVVVVDFAVTVDFVGSTWRIYERSKNKKKN